MKAKSHEIKIAVKAVIDLNNPQFRFFEKDELAHHSEVTNKGS